MNYRKKQYNIFNSRFIRFSRAALIFSSFFAFIHYLDAKYVPFYVDSLVFVVLLINLRYTKSYRYKTTFFLGTIFLFFIYLFTSGGIYNTGILWSLTFPTFAFLLNNKFFGTLWSASYGVVLTSVLGGKLFWDITVYTNEQLAVFILLYMMEVYLMYLFQNEVDSFTKDVIVFNNRLTEMVKEEIEKNKAQNELIYFQSKQAQMGEMLSMIAHQWRQPLNAISANVIKLQLENQMDMIDAEKIEQSSSYIQTKAQEMSEVLNVFLEFATQTDKEKKHFLACESIEKVIFLMQEQLNSFNIRLEVQNENEKMQIFGIENLLEQVLLNLFTNSKDAYNNLTAADKKIIIEIQKSGNINVIDYAGGISEKVASKIFDPYFTTRGKLNGTGLGLYMSQKIMREHFEGNLVYSKRKNGSCFSLRFNSRSKYV